MSAPVVTGSSPAPRSEPSGGGLAASAALGGAVALRPSVPASTPAVPVPVPPRLSGPGALPALPARRPPAPSPAPRVEVKVPRGLPSSRPVAPRPIRAESYASAPPRAPAPGPGRPFAGLKVVKVAGRSPAPQPAPTAPSARPSTPATGDGHKEGLSRTNKAQSKRQQRLLFARLGPGASAYAKRGAAFKRLPERVKP